MIFTPSSDRGQNRLKAFSRFNGLDNRAVGALPDSIKRVC